jgi:glycosyltransferase involved in cell wall biosynthesis
MDSDKDIPTIISAFSDFYKRENRPDIKMVFVGDGNIANDMKKMAGQSDAAKNIVFLGKIPKPYGYMHGAMAHILSSYNEGLPTVLIESMAADTLNISSNCPSGPHEILLDGKAGILFEPGNVNELSNAMSDVFHNRVNVNAMKKCATKALDRFDVTKISEQIINLIKQEIKK